jgi:hypothetical protein
MSIFSNKRPLVDNKTNYGRCPECSEPLQEVWESILTGDKRAFTKPTKLSNSWFFSHLMCVGYLDINKFYGFLKESQIMLIPITCSYKYKNQQYESYNVPKERMTSSMLSFVNNVEDRLFYDNVDK